MSSENKKPTQKRPTIYDLADMAGVSPGTVSRVLNNRNNVRAQTRAKILELAREIGLKPQVTVRTKEIAVVTEPHYTDRFYGYSNVLTSHVAFALSERGIGMLLPSDPLNQLNDYFIDGVIAITYQPDIYKMLCTLEKKMPVVYLDNFAATEGQYVISSDHYDSGYKAAKCFIEHGNKNLAFIGGDVLPFQERLKGYLAGMESAGIEPQEKLQVLMRQDDSLYLAVNRIVKKGADSIFVPGCSMQVIEALHVLTNVMGLTVPKDISLIGGENAGVSMFLHPPLTCIKEPLEDMAKEVVRKVVDLSDGKKPKEANKVFPVELIERESVG
ncbi:MAG: LacI family DNA-binding transcriptional regulator [Sedimentisphaerales bacterium]|nr:LacI family DNA-binding transcriptional regulator [Sedimentisphaerales bacterium]